MFLKHNERESQPQSGKKLKTIKQDVMLPPYLNARSIWNHNNYKLFLIY